MNVNIAAPRIGPQPWEIVRTKLDQALPFANMRNTPYYRDAVYEQFSKQEYERRYAALRTKMLEHKLDCLVVPGGPSHWSFGGGMLWLTGHWEWHALAAYVLVPLKGEPTLIEAMVARAKPGVKEYELRAAAGAAILEGGGDIDFLIIGSTPMENPALIFGNPRPSGRVLKKGDIINMELAAGFRGYSAQIGSPICVGEPTEMVRKFWDEITLPGYKKIVAEIAPGKPTENMRIASKFFRDNGVQSRPTQCHGIDLVTDNPHISAEHVKGEEIDMILKPGMIIMAEPNPTTS